MSSTARPSFHLAIPVDDLAAARGFYGEVLGLPEGRSAAAWVDWNFHGHQLVTHVVPGARAEAGRNPVDGHDVPVPHFGLILGVDDFHVLAGKLRDAGTEFVIEPYQRFAGEPGEQWTMSDAASTGGFASAGVLHDPAGNALEFKAFRDSSQLFAR